MRTLGFPHALFALAATGLAAYSLAFGDFAPAGQTLPAWIPGRPVWVCGSAILVLVAGAGLFLPRTLVPGILTIAAYLAVWLLLGVPAIIAAPLSVGGWYGFCEALSALAGAWIIYASLRPASDALGAALAGESAIRVAQILFGLTCIFYGWSHFVYADYTATMVPAWLPGQLALAYVTGFGHAAAGIALVIGVLPRLAANLEAAMVSLFSLLVWVPSFFAQPRPPWATPPQNQWSEFVVTAILTAAAWVVAASLRDRPWSFARPARS